METVSEPNKIGRIGFIDLMRAFAILMMVQGHLTDALLRLDLRNPDNPIYYAWSFMRGVTAPVFFFASGIIFTFLLFKEEKYGTGINNPRVRKGIKRALYLFAIGYALQFNSNVVWFFFTFDFSLLKYFFTVHVLHIIGMAILLISVFYLIFRNLNINEIYGYFFAALIFFAFEPFFNQYDFSGDYFYIFQNFVTKKFGSVFTIFPWVGFSLLGASFGSFIVKYPKYIYSKRFFMILLASGIILYIISQLDFLTGNFHIEYSISMMKTGFALVVAGIFGFLDRVINKFDKIYILGRETLPIFIIHYMLIYGTFTGLGLVPLFGKTSLNGWECSALAIIVEAIVIFFALNYRKPKQKLINFWNKKFSRP